MRPGLIVALLVAAAPAFGAQRQPPPRDATAAPQKGTAVIRGRVVAGDTGRALRRARITIVASELGDDGRRSTSTDLDGRYEFRELPAARYRVSATRAGYLPLDYGQRRPGEQGRPVQLGDGETLERVDFALPRTSGIAGRVTDENGEPIEGVSIFIMRAMFYEGRRKLVPVGSPSLRTDDEGEYRVPRLAPGTYVVKASTHETWTVMEQGKAVVYGYMPTYFPGVTSTADARRVTIGVGQTARTTDFSLVPGRAAKISGFAFDSHQHPFARVGLSEEIRGIGFASFGGALPGAAVAADGSFTIKDVPPGEYTLSAVRYPDDAQGPPEVAMTTVNVDGADIDGVTLYGSGGGKVTGRIVVDGPNGPADPPLKMSAIRLTIGEVLKNQPSPVLLGAFRSGGGSTRVKDDGTFAVEHVFGRARFQVTLPDGWMLQAVTRENRDLTDATIELANDEELNGVDIVVTNRITTVAGQVTDEKGAAVADATVILFAADTAKWLESSRHVRAARPDQQGQWRVKGLPPGEYFAIAPEYVEDGAWDDPEYLQAMSAAAQRFTINEGASQTLRLKVVRPK